jgi:GNAT superfamily N-acetyltransferase
VIRVAREADAGDVATILHRTFAPFESRYTSAAFRATVLSPDEVRSRIVEGRLWVAESGGEIVGTVGALPRGDALYVCGMAVLPLVQGRGIGRKLLAEVEAFARATGRRRLDLRTTPFLTAARRLYRRSGFHEVGPLERPHGTPLIRMEKRLGPG